MAQLSGVRVVFMNVKVPKSWEASSNAAVGSCASRHGAPVLDWRGYSSPHADWFYADGIHLRAREARLGYASLVASGT